MKYYAKCITGYKHLMWLPKYSPSTHHRSVAQYRLHLAETWELDIKCFGRKIILIIAGKVTKDEFTKRLADPNEPPIDLFLHVGESLRNQIILELYLKERHLSYKDLVL